MGFIAYGRYKESGLNTVGKMPLHWSIRRLKFMARIQNGKDYKDVVSDDGFPVIGSGGEFAKASSYLYNGESVLLGRKGTIDRPLYINGPFWTVDTMFYTEVASDVSAKYLYYCALTINFQKYSTSTALPSMTQQDLGTIPFAVPEYEEQQTIARFLDFKTAQIDALIAKKKTLLEKLAEKRTALISHAVTKGLDPSVPMKDSGVEWLGKIPATWDTKRLRFLTTMAGGMTPSTGAPEYWNGDIPWITPKDMKRDALDASIDMLTDKAVAETGIRLHESGRVLIVVRGMILAHTFPVAINTVPATVNQDMKALSSSLNRQYLAFFLKGIQGLILSLTEESAHGTKVLRTDVFKNIFLPVPPSDEQEEIVRTIYELTTRLDGQRRAVESVIDRLREYRSALITNAVTGKIDVRDFQIPDPVAKELCDA
jgi:type I restriction enzyme S subunit